MQGKALTLQELAQLTNGQLVGDANHVIRGVADLENATAEDASFLANANYGKAMRLSHAGVIFITASTAVIQGRNFLIVKSPSMAFQKAAETLLRDHLPPLSAFQAIHPTAIIHENASLGKDVTVGPHAIIDAHVTIGNGTTIGAGCYIGPQTKIGTNCLIHPRVVIREGCTIGNRVILQPGAVIGSCGFGYEPDERGRHIKLDHFAGVLIEDDVEIGANSTIDRGRLNPTRISRGTKIDNLVQIAHGVIVGEDNIIVAQSGIAGSTTTGKHVIIAGQVAVNGHISIADGVVIAAKSGIAKSITEAGTYGGIPAVPMDKFRRQIVQLKKLAEKNS